MSYVPVVSLDYHGLKSPGLTCYLNSILQVLFMTEDFREAVKGFVSPAVFWLSLYFREVRSNEKGGKWLLLLFTELK